MEKQLTKAEEQIMQVLWDLEKTSVKGIVEVLSEPKPAYNTVSTIIRILEQKEFVGHEAKGRGYEYFPLIQKEEYSNQSLHKLVDGYFGGSFQSMVSFFVKKNEVDLNELEDMMKLINEEKSES